MKNKHGYTYIEMLISLVMASILVLTMAAFSGIGKHSYNKTTTEAQAFDDIYYGFKLMQSRIRSASAMYSEAQTGLWASRKLIVDDSAIGKRAFGLYQTAATIDFVYLPDEEDETQREVFFSIPSSLGSVNLTFYKPTGDPSNPWTPLSGTEDDLDVIKAELAGNKGKIPFNISTIIERRI